jgi:hypothetical protein
MKYVLILLILNGDISKVEKVEFDTLYHCEQAQHKMEATAKQQHVKLVGNCLAK